MSKYLASGRRPLAWIALTAIFALLFGGISSPALSWAEEGDGSPSPSSQSVESQAPQAPESTQASEPESKDQPTRTTEKQAPSSPKATPTQKVESSKAQKPEASKSVKTTPVKTEPKKSQAPPTPKTSKTTPSSNRSSPPTLDRYSTFTVSACEKVTVSLSSSAPVAYTISFFIEEPWQQVGTSFNLVPGGTKTVGLPAGTFIAIAAAEGMRQEINQVTVEVCKPPQPDAKIDYSEWKDGDKSCENKTVTQTRTKTTTPYKWDGTEWVLDSANASSATEIQTRPMTAEEIAACEVIPPGQYRLETSHTQTCGSVTITLRNVSPWIYPVSYSLDGSTPNASGPFYGPVVDNRTNGGVSGPAKDQTGSKTLTFTEDQGGGHVTVKYVVAAGTESDLYKGLPVGQVTTVLVDTNCQPDPVPVKPVGATKIDTCEPATGPTPDGVVVSEDPNFTYENKTTGDQLAVGFTRVEGTSVTVAAVPKEGVVVEEGAQLEWTFEFTKEPCAADDVFAPEGKIDVTCDKGSAVLDNSKSTVEVVYQVVRNGTSTYYSVPAGQTKAVEFAGGENVKVALWALDALIDEDTSPAKCGKAPPVPPVAPCPDDCPPAGPPAPPVPPNTPPSTPPAPPQKPVQTPKPKPGQKSTEVRWPEQSRTGGDIGTSEILGALALLVSAGGITVLVRRKK